MFWVGLIIAGMLSLGADAKDAVHSVPSLLNYQMRNMTLGCAIGGGAGAVIGLIPPIVTGFGTVAVPYTASETAMLGCVAGTTMMAVGTVAAAEAATFVGY